nr:hypothetical protein [Tanacetum cinerariifolium]
MSINSGKPAGSKSASKVATLSGTSQPKPLLFLDQLEVDVAGTIVVMIGRVWDVNDVTRRYLRTDFVVSNSKGNMIHWSAKSSVAHNFLRLKEGARKVSVDPHGFCRYPLRLIEFDQVEPANNKGQSLRVTLWGELGDILVEKKTKHAGVYAMVLIGMSGKKYMLEAVVADDTTHTVVVMFSDTVTELLKCSAESLMGTEDEYSDADDELNLPVAIRNLIGTAHVLEVKSHTYYEYGTFESFNCWKINPNASAEDDASSSMPAVTANDA